MTRPKIVLLIAAMLIIPAALADSLFSIADITVVAPYQQQSGTGHGISFRDPIKVFDLWDFAAPRRSV